MKNFKNAPRTKAKLPANERIIGGDVDRNCYNNRIPVIQKTFKERAKNGK